MTMQEWGFTEMSDYMKFLKAMQLMSFCNTR